MPSSVSPGTRIRAPNVTGFTLYVGRSSGVYTATADMGFATTGTYTINADGDWFLR
jgi:hypothetical protein